MGNLYIYLDESGNFDFTDKGTPFLLLCAMTTTQPATTQQPLQELKYKLLEDGTDIEGFHATEDEQRVRDLVFKSIGGLDGIGFHYAYIDKKRLSADQKNDALIYELLSKKILDHCLSLEIAIEADKIIVIFDKVFNARGQKKQKALIKPVLAATGKPYWLYFHRIMLDFNAQIADYGAWALYVKLSRNEKRPMMELEVFQPTILDATPE